MPAGATVHPTRTTRTKTAVADTVLAGASVAMPAINAAACEGKGCFRPFPFPFPLPLPSPPPVRASARLELPRRPFFPFFLPDLAFRPALPCGSPDTRPSLPDDPPSFIPFGSGPAGKEETTARLVPPTMPQQRHVSVAHLRCLSAYVAHLPLRV